MLPTPEDYATYPAPLRGRPPAAPSAGPWSRGVQVPSDGPIRLSLEEAILLALDNNREYRVQRYTPQITRTAEEVERARFDPNVTASASASRRQTESPLTAGGVEDLTITQTQASASVTQVMPTGTAVQAQVSHQRTFQDGDVTRSDQHEVRVGLTVTQALLRGFGPDVNLATLRQARLDTRASEYELRGVAEALVARVEETFWSYALAVRSIKIFQDSVDLAAKQLAETQERVRVGKLAASELSAAQAELARRQEDLINARSDMEKARLELLRLISPQTENLLGRQLELLDEPVMDQEKLGDVEDHVRLALRMRPELNQARLQVRRGDLEVIRTASGLLPRLDAFIQLGKSGLAGGFTDSVRQFNGDNYDALVGLNFEYPPVNREARANHRAAMLSREQAAEAVANLEQLVEVDVRNAIIEVNRAREQVAATRATREFRAETLRVESERFKVGKTTSFQVAQAQRDLVASEIAEVQAIVTYRNALVELYRLEGSLLLRRGIDAPGAQPEDIVLP